MVSKVVIFGVGNRNENLRLLEILSRKMLGARVLVVNSSGQAIESVADIFAIRARFDRMILDTPKLSLPRIKVEPPKPRAIAGKIKILGRPKRDRRYVIPAPRRGCR